MNQQQQGHGTNDSNLLGAAQYNPRPDMEYLCAGERSDRYSVAIHQPTLVTQKIAVPRMRSNLANPFVVENVAIA